MAGFACQVGVSSDMQFVISGDGTGNLWFWDWKRTKVLKYVAFFGGRGRGEGEEGSEASQDNMMDDRRRQGESKGFT